MENVNFELNKVEGVATATCTNENAYKENVGIEMSTIKKVEEANSGYVESCLTTAADYALEQFKADSELQQVNAVFPFTTSKRGNVTVTTHRSKEFTNLKDGSKIVTATVQVAVKAPFLKPSSTVIKDKKDMLNSALGN